MIGMLLKCDRKKVHRKENNSFTFSILHFGIFWVYPLSKVPSSLAAKKLY